MAVGPENMQVMFSHWDSDPRAVQFSSVNSAWHTGSLWKMFIHALMIICDLLIVYQLPGLGRWAHAVGISSAHGY